MAFDGSAWTESSPTNSDLANEIDDNMRDMKKGVSGRMRREHIWPASQAATNEGGYHTYITFQPQTGAPAFAGTTSGGLWFSTTHDGFYIDSGANSFMIFKSAQGLTISSGTATRGSILFVTSGGGVVSLTASAAGLALISNNNTANPSWATVLTATSTATISGNITFATNVNLGGNTITNGGLGVTSQTSYHFVSNPEVFTIPSGYYVNGATRDVDGSFGGLSYAKL